MLPSAAPLPLSFVSPFSFITSPIPFQSIGIYLSTLLLDHWHWTIQYLPIWIYNCTWYSRVTKFRIQSLTSGKAIIHHEFCPSLSTIVKSSIAKNVPTNKCDSIKSEKCFPFTTKEGVWGSAYLSNHANSDTSCKNSNTPRKQNEKTTPISSRHDNSTWRFCLAQQTNIFHTLDTGKSRKQWQRRNQFSTTALAPTDATKGFFEHSHGFPKGVSISWAGKI